MSRVTVSYEAPPIPDGKYDWCVYDSENEEDSVTGYGSTAKDALVDFAEKLLAELDELRGKA